MAKMIKCPTCGTQIEVPPNSAGQIVKCPGCGKGLKLVAKKPAGAAGGQQQQSAGAGLGGSPGGSVAGGSVSAMTFVGDPPPMERAGPPLDDMPSLDSTCAVCGRPTDPDDLVEDNGRLVCMDCVKGARSAIARPEGGAELIDFKPASLPVRRGKLINFSPSFFVGTLAALVLIGTQIYLTLFEKPVGTRTALHTTPQRGGAGAGAAPEAPFDPDTNPAPAPPAEGTAPGDAATTAPSDATATPPPPAPGETPAPGDTTAAATPAPEPGAAPAEPAAPSDATPTSNPAVATAAPADGGSIFTDGPPAGAAPAAPADGVPAPDAEPPADANPPAPAPAPAITSNDPLDRGMEKLMVGEYVAAANELNSARQRYVVGKYDPRGPLTPQQQLTLEALGAAYIGQKRFEAAAGPLDMVGKANVRSRSLVLNTAIRYLNTRTSLDRLIVLADLVQSHMGRERDEYAADIFGTLVAKIESMDRAPKDKVEQYWAFYDTYVDQVAKEQNAGKLKWGIDWLPEEEVRKNRELRRLAGSPVGVQAAAKDVEAAAQRARTAQDALTRAQADRKKGEAADEKGAQTQLDAANAALAEAQKKLANANAAMNFKPPRWLTNFPPVIPEPIAAPPGGAR